MTIYMVSKIEDADGEAYWVNAHTPDEARAMVAATFPNEAKDARDPTKFKCEPDGEKQPAFGMIYRRNYGPEAVR